MNLIQIDENTLINPERISFVEKTKRGVTVVVDGKIFLISDDNGVKNFFSELKVATNNLWGAQHFGG